LGFVEKSKPFANPTTRNTALISREMKHKDIKTAHNRLKDDVMAVVETSKILFKEPRCSERV
jgi:hypothetical protein